MFCVEFIHYLVNLFKLFNTVGQWFEIAAWWRVIHRLFPVVSSAVQAVVERRGHGGPRPVQIKDIGARDAGEHCWQLRRSFNGCWTLCRRCYAKVFYHCCFCCCCFKKINKFGNYRKRYLSLSLIKNCVSPVPRVFQLTATIARHVLTKVFYVYFQQQQQQLIHFFQSLKQDWRRNVVCCGRRMRVCWALPIRYKHRKWERCNWFLMFVVNLK